MPLPSLPPTGSPDHADEAETALRDVLGSAADVRRQIMARASAELLEWCFRLRASPSSLEVDKETVLALVEEIGLVLQALDLAGVTGTAARVDRLLGDLGFAEPEDDAAAMRLAEETATALAAGGWSLLTKGRRL